MTVDVAFKEYSKVGAAPARSSSEGIGLPQRPPGRTMPRVPSPAKAIYVAPGRRPPPPRAPPTYCLRLERETADGFVTLHVWSGIPHQRVKPLLSAMRSYLPILVKAAAAREAFDKVLDLFR